MHENAVGEFVDFGEGDDVSAEAGLDFPGFPAEHFEGVTRPNGFACIGDEQLSAGIQFAAENADGCVFHIGAGIVSNAEDQSRQRAIGIGFNFDFLVAVDEHRRFCLQRRGSIQSQHIHQFLDADFGFCVGEKNGDNGAGYEGLDKNFGDFFVRDCFSGQVAFH